MADLAILVTLQFGSEEAPIFGRAAERRDHRWQLAVAITVVACCLTESPTSADDDLPSLDTLLATEVSAAARYAQTSFSAPASVTILTADDVAAHGWRTLGEALRTVRGFYLSDDRNYAYLGTRGFSRPTDYNNRILLMVDGHPFNEPIFGSMPVGADLGLDLGAFERIEVVRGPSSSLYGTSAMFAVVNLVTKKGGAIAGGVARAEAGTHGRYGAFLLLGQGGDLDWSASLAGALAHGSDVALPELSPTPARDLDRERWAGTLATLRWREFSLLAAATSRWKQVPTAAYGTNFGDDDADTTDARQVLDLRWQRELSAASALTLRAAFDRYHYEGTFPYEENYFDEAEAKTLTAEAQWRWDPAASQRWVFGAEYRSNQEARYRYASGHQLFYDRDAPFHVTSLYAQTEWDLASTLSMTLGLRHDRFSSFGGSTNPRLALVWNPRPATSVKLISGRAFRAPSVFEQEYEDPVSGHVANPDLEPERIRTVEASWEERLGESAFVGASLYDYRVSDLIDTVATTEGGSRFENVDRVSGRGLELEVGWRGPRLAGSASWIAQRAETDDRRLSNSPAYGFRLRSEWRPAVGTLVAGDVAWDAERITLAETRTDDSCLISARIALEPAKWWRTAARLDGWTFAVGVRNLLDDDAANPGGFEHLPVTEIPQEGRTFTFNIEKRLP